VILVPSGVRVWLAVGHTDMRRGMNSLAIQVQQGLGRDPHAGDLYVPAVLRKLRFPGSALELARSMGYGSRKIRPDVNRVSAMGCSRVMAPTNDRLGVRPIWRPHLCAPATPPKPSKFSICC
jgi:hypothetical protein